MVTPVLSGSMRPGFAVGGVVISERVPLKDLAVRDVIVFQRPNDPSVEMVHRIVAMTTNSSGQLAIKTRGDANTVRDPWTLVPHGSSAYRVRWSVPLIGYVAIAFQNHRGIALAVTGLVLLLLALATAFGARGRRQRRGGSAPEESPEEGTPGESAKTESGKAETESAELSQASSFGVAGAPPEAGSAALGDPPVGANQPVE